MANVSKDDVVAVLHDIETTQPGFVDQLKVVREFIGAVVKPVAPEADVEPVKPAPEHVFAFKEYEPVTPAPAEFVAEPIAPVKP